MARSSSPSEHDRAADARPPAAVAGVGALAAGVAVLLLAFAGRYGYHRDELYFLAAGHHLAWGYPDQPPLVPALARAISAVAPGSLPVLRLPSALAMAAVVWLTGSMTRALGGGRTAQVLAAGVMAVSSIVLAVGHLLSTATFQLLTWTLLSWVLIRIIGGADQRWWLLAGVVVAVGLLDNVLMLTFVVGLLVAILLVGPRDILRSWWLVLGVVVAVAAWVPYLHWQATHSWPQIEMSRAIAAGSSGSSQPRWAFLPFQLLLVSPWLTPVWGAGLWRLLRSESLRPWRAIAVGYLVLAVLFLVTAGKPYYITGLYPALVAAGAPAVVAWWRRGRTRLRPAAVVAGFVLSAPSLLVTLPVLPAANEGPVVALNYDAGETIGWPAYVAQIAAVYHRVESTGTGTTAIVTSNYGEAGAVDRYGPGDGLPQAYSGHNGFWYWGPPPGNPTTVVAVGFDRASLGRAFRTCVQAGRLHNDAGIDNDEQHVPVLVCHGPRRSWVSMWPDFRILG